MLYVLQFVKVAQKLKINGDYRKVHIIVVKDEYFVRVCSTAVLPV